MVREGKHDRFSHELCELLSPYFAPDHAYQPGIGNWLLKRTPFGTQRIGVILSGANAPFKQLEFHLGLRYDAYQTVACRLGLEEQYPDGSDHFWNTTFNCIKHFPPAGNRDARGMWSINLNSPGQEYVPDIWPVLTAVSEAFFRRFSDIRASRDALLRHDGTLFQTRAWERIALTDLALKDFTHLRQFAVAEMRGWGLQRDESLWQKIRVEFANEVDL
jgi:hypothetical protein